jgi:hypothetical protein
MIIGYKKKAPVIVLHPDEVPHRSEIIPKMQVPR